MAKMDYASFDASQYSRKELVKIYYNMAAALNMRSKRSKDDPFEVITDSFLNIEDFKKRHRKLKTKSGNITKSLPKSMTLKEVRTITEQMAEMLTMKSPKHQAKELEQQKSRLLTPLQKSELRKKHPMVANKLVKKYVDPNSEEYFDKDGSPDETQKEPDEQGGESIVDKFYQQDITMEDVEKAIKDELDNDLKEVRIDPLTGQMYYVESDGSKTYRT